MSLDDSGSLPVSGLLSQTYQTLGESYEVGNETSFENRMPLQTSSPDASMGIESPVMDTESQVMETESPVMDTESPLMGTASPVIGTASPANRPPLSSLSTNQASSNSSGDDAESNHLTEALNTHKQVSLYFF